MTKVSSQGVSQLLRTENKIPPSLLLCLVGAVSAGCVAPGSQSLTAEQETAISASVLSLTQAYNDAWSEWRAAPILQFHGEGFQYYWFDERLGDEFEHVLRNMWLSESKAYSIEMIDPQVQVLGHEAAVVSFNFRDREVAKDGSVDENTGALTYIFKRSNGQWKIVRIHHSGPVPDKYGGQTSPEAP